MKSMSISQYFQVIKPEYIYLKLKPDTSIRNYNSSYIVKSISSMYKSIIQQIKIEEKKFVFETQSKCSFYINIERELVDFYFIIPKQYLNIIKTKIIETWPKITIEEVSSIPQFTANALKYQLKYSKEDAMSLSLDKKCNEPLNSILNILDVLEEKDHIGIFYNFIPMSQLPWKKLYTETIQKVKDNHPIDREKHNVKYMLKVTILYVLELIDYIVEVVAEMMGGNIREKDNLSLVEAVVTAMMIKDKKELSKTTNNKKYATVLKTQLVVLSESLDKKKELNNAITVCESFNTISEDNNLIYRKINNNFNFNDFKVKNVEDNIMSVEECQNFLELPGRSLLEQHKMISKIDVLESEVPCQLQEGIVRAGISNYRGKSTNVYQTEDAELKNTATCVCGPNRSGKTTLLANMINDNVNAGRTVIIPDFCGKCQLSDELAEVIPKDKILNIECNVWDTLQGFGYNEITPIDDSIFELYNCAKMKAAKLKELINLVNDGDNDLEGRMERYLEYAALVVFICNGSVNDVFKVLKQHKLRHEYIDKIPLELKDTVSEYVEELCEIDDWSKATKDCPSTIVGTKQGHISAVLSRVHRLKQNAYIELMLKKSTDDNINLIDEVQKGKLICIRMYDSMFATQQQKDIYVCYWITKIWGSLQKRFCDIPKKDLVQTTILIDELYQTKNCEKYLTMILSQMPKYETKLILSCHHLDQIPFIQEELKSASCSYMFIAGSNKKNFKAMKEEFEDKGYILEDLLRLKRYHALCLLMTEEGYWAGVVKMPPPVKIKKE